MNINVFERQLHAMLGPIEAQIRLRALLVAVLRQIASPSQLVVLFLDDLHWAEINRHSISLLPC